MTPVLPAASPGDVEPGSLGWRERRKAAKRAKAERTGDSPEKSNVAVRPDRGSSRLDCEQTGGLAEAG